MHCFTYRVLATVALLGGLAFPFSFAVDDVNLIRNPTTKAARSSNTCADPTLANTVFEAFDASGTTHQLNFLQVFENVNVVHGTLAFANELPVFKAWPTQQEFLFPLFQLAQVTPHEVIYVLGSNAASPPIISGFINPVIIAWVYSSQVCGSVPLMSATLPSASDTYYTIDQSVHDGLVALGWSDAGVVAFVLPLYTS